jgi:hypothetical protein
MGVLMEELIKARVQKAVNKLVRMDSNIPSELIEHYKESLINSVCELFDVLNEMYDDSDIMKSSVEHFIETNFKEKKYFNSKGYNTEGYLVANIPIILPIEAIAIVDEMEDHSLPLILSQLSGFMIRTIMEFKELDKLEDALIKKEGTMLAEALKEKGWIA